MHQNIGQLIAQNQGYEHLLQKEIEKLFAMDEKLHTWEGKVVKKKKTKSVDMAAAKVGRLKKQLQLWSAKLKRVEETRGKMEKEVIADLRVLKRSFYGLHQRLLQERQDQGRAVRKIKEEIARAKQKEIEDLMAPNIISIPDVSDDDSDIPDDAPLEYEEVRRRVLAKIIRNEEKAALRRKRAEQLLKKDSKDSIRCHLDAVPTKKKNYRFLHPR